MSNRNGNGCSGLAAVQRMDRDAEVKLLASLPAQVRDYIRYDLPFDVYVPSIANHIKTHGVDAAMTLMRSQVAKQTLKAYGPDHPQSTVEA